MSDSSVHPSYMEVLHLAQAGARVIQIASHEWERVRGLCTWVSRELDLLDIRWNQSAGLMDVGDRSRSFSSDPGLLDPMNMLAFVAGADEGMVVLLEDVQPFLHEAHHQVIRMVRELCHLPDEPRKLIILSTPIPGLPVELSKEVPTVELPLPEESDLKKVCMDVAERLEVPLDADNDALIQAARGLTVMEARLAFGQAAVKLERLGRAAVPLVAGEKKRIIKRSGVLEYFDPDAGMADVGGLDSLKAWLDRRERAFSPGARHYGLEAPKGVMLLGVQGCGKSLVAKAVASAWRFPLLRFDVGKVYGGVVGESEGNMRLALQVAQALAPCVLWIDEIEKGLSGMGSSNTSDAGTSARVVGTLLTWMQEKKEEVFVVATANRLDMLPPELLRKGRFDELFFVDLPTRAVRAEILAIHLRRRDRDPDDFDLERLADRSRGFSGAELEEAVREGMFAAFAESDPLETRHIEEALEATYPLSRVMRDQIDDLRRWAAVRTRPASSEKAEELTRGDGTGIPRLQQESPSLFVPEKQA